MKNQTLNVADDLFVIATYLGQPIRIQISPEDLELVSSIPGKWHVSNAGGIQNRVTNEFLYASTQIAKKTIYMHRFILGEPKGKVVDHRDGNGLNNRRENIRAITHAENLRRRRIIPKPSRSKLGVPNVQETYNGKYAVSVAGHYVGLFEKLKTAKQVAENVVDIVNTLKMAS